MKKVHFTILVTHIEFDTDDQKTESEMIKEYSFNSEILTYDDFENLFVKLKQLKGDWITNEITIDENTVYASTNLLYPYFNGIIKTQAITEILSKVLATVEDFININKSNASQNITDNINEIDNVTEGLLLRIDGHNSIERFDILKELKQNNINYKIITHKVKQADQGASDLFSEVILFIANTVISGLAYDIIKKGFTNTLRFMGSPSDIDEHKVENINYKKLRKNVGLRANVQPNELTLIDMRQKKDGITFKFQSNNSIITVLCDANHVIQKFNLKDLTVSKQEV